MPRYSLDHARGNKPLPFYVMADLLIRMRSAEDDPGCRGRKIAIGENVLALAQRCQRIAGGSCGL
jgi:hypothetical protein